MKDRVGLLGVRRRGAERAARRECGAPRRGVWGALAGLVMREEERAGVREF